MKLRTQLGFTLLELLLVVFLLGVLAMTTFAVVQEGDDQQRFDATKTYYQLIKKAIVGDTTLTLNGETDVSGFVADIGRLPNCLRELVEISGCDGVVGVNAITGLNDDLPVWAQDADSQVWSGWRGPYLQGIPESGIGLAFRDGWKNIGGATNTDARNYGWLFGTVAAGVDNIQCGNAALTQPIAGGLVVQSCGSDGLVRRPAALTDNGYEQDYPFYDADNNLATREYLPLVVEADYSVPLGDDWDSIAVRLTGNNGTVTFGGGGAVEQSRLLRLKLNYPENGPGFNSQVLSWEAPADPQLDTAAERDASIFLSKTFPPVISGKTVNITVPSTLSAASLSVPSDADLIIDSGTPDEAKITLSNCPCELPVTGVTTTPGTVSSITFNATGTIGLPVNKTVFYADGLLKPDIIIPTGSTLDSPTQITLPNGATLTFAQPFNSIYSPIIILDSDDPTVTVSEAFTRSNNTIITSTSNDQFTVTDGTPTPPTGNVLDIAARSSVPIGRRSLTIVCEQFGTNFDGNCANDATANNPVATPYSFTVKPRATLSPPSVLRWQVN